MYPLLDFVKTVSVENMSDTHPFKKLMVGLDGREGRALSFLTYEKSFLDPEYDGEFADLNQWLIKNREHFYKLMFGEDHPGYVHGTKADHDAAADCILPYLMARLWEKNKQVYTFDKELEEMLSDMEEVKVPVRILDRLPFTEMYIQFAEDGIFAENFHGAFVKVFQVGSGYAIEVLRLAHNLKAMTGFIPLFPESDSIVWDNGVKDESENPVFIINKETDIDSSETGSHIQYKQFSIFLFNALLYLCSENAEVRQSKLTKNTYRKSKVIRNKFSEIQINECGYVYGSMVRKQRAAQKDCSEDDEAEKPVGVGNKIRHSSTVRAHVRRAHWHHYWTGKGRTELVLRWIAPTPIGYGERLATIHKVSDK